MAQIRQTVLKLVLTGALCESAVGQVPKFFADDPIGAMPAPLPIRKTPPRQEINDVLDFLVQSGRWAPRPAKPSGAVNTLGEVPDSEWFTNRHGQHRMSREELQHGRGSSEEPVPPFTVTGGKNEGVSAGFRMKDAKDRRYFVKADPLGYPELATAAEVIVSRFLYAIGYNTPKNYIVDLKVSDLRVSKSARITLPGGRSREMTWKDVEGIVKQIPHYADGSFRIMASLAIEGENVGPFRYEGTRSDDPNDTIAHEDRRDLRGLNVFSAWLNNTDMKASNTLDTIVEENGTRFIRHYLLDFGSALGSDGTIPKDPRLGHEFMLPTPLGALTQILKLGLVPASWERARFPKLPAVGNFESQLFDPDLWKPDYPNPAFLSRLPDDDYWAAKQVMAFTDDDIRAIVETARFTDARATEYIIATLEERRNKIGRTFFSKILPLDHFRVENDELLFDDLAVLYGFHAPRTYEMRWSRFDNIRQKHDPITGSESTRLPPEAGHAAPGSYYSAVIDASGEPLKPVSVYLRKKGNSYKIVGVERM
jgi:hypothetical protein